VPVDILFRFIFIKTFENILEIKPYLQAFLFFGLIFIFGQINQESGDEQGYS